MNRHAATGKRLIPSAHKTGDRQGPSPDEDHFLLHIFPVSVRPTQAMFLQAFLILGVIVFPSGYFFLCLFFEWPLLLETFSGRHFS